MSKRLKELRQRIHDAKAEAQALFKSAQDASREFSDIEEKRWAELEADIEALKPQIEKEERMMDRARSIEALPSLPALTAAVPGLADPTMGFANIADFAISVRRACSPNAMIDRRLISAAPVGAMEGGGSVAEGFELPTQFRDTIWELAFAMDDIMSTVDLEPTSAREVSWIADESTPWSASGVTASWRAENTQMSASKLSTKQRNMSLHELYAFVLATEELLEDAPRLNARLTRRAAEAINWKIGEALVYGTGAGQPLGWFNSPALVSVAKEAGQTADTIVVQNVLKMYSRFMNAPNDPGYWLMNRSAITQLPLMIVGDVPIWMPPNGLISAPGGILMGLPIHWSQHAKQLGDKGDIQLVSPKGYYAARRTNVPNFATSIHLFFDYNVQAFRWTFRFGGQPHLSAPVSPANGTDTTSHFVTLDDRA